MSISEESGSSVIHLSGELDIASRQRCLDACLAGDHVGVVVDMAALTFMDCAGYGGLVSAGRVLRERGGTLTLRHPTAQPARLLSIMHPLDPLAERPDANLITVEEPKERTTTRDP